MSGFILPENDFRLRYRELIPFTPHRLDQDRQVQFTSSADLKGIRVLCILNAQRYIRIQLPHETFPDLPGCAVFSLTAGERAVIDDKIHGDRRLRDLLERNCIFLSRRTDRITDLKSCDP